jgi:hypothetical protein
MSPGEICQGFFAKKVIKMKNATNTEIRERVVTFLNREEVDFLDKIGKDALFTAGAKLSRAKLICWLVDFVKNSHMNGENIKSARDFEDRLRKFLGQNQEGSVPTCHGRKN